MKVFIDSHNCYYGHMSSSKQDLGLLVDNTNAYFFKIIILLLNDIVEWDTIGIGSKFGAQLDNIHTSYFHHDDKSFVHNFVECIDLVLDTC